MYDSLNINLATRVGVNAALIAQVLWDESDDGMWTVATFYKGRLWIKASYRALATVMPYLSHHQIKHSINRLVGLGILNKQSRLAKNHFDSTNWYSFSDVGDLLMKATEHSMFVIEGGELDQQYASL